MAAKTIVQAIDDGMFLPSVTPPPLIDMRIRIQNEVRDFFAHEMYRYISEEKAAGRPWRVAEETLNDFINKVFVDIPGSKK